MVENSEDKYEEYVFSEDGGTPAAENQDQKNEDEKRKEKEKNRKTIELFDLDYPTENEEKPPKQPDGTDLSAKTENLFPKERQKAPEVPGVEPRPKEKKSEESYTYVHKDDPSEKEMFAKPEAKDTHEIKDKHDLHDLSHLAALEEPLPRKKSPYPLIALSVSMVILTVSAYYNLKLGKELSDTRNKASANAEVAKKLLVEKEKILEQLRSHAPIKEEADKLSKELKTTQDEYSRIEQQNQTLRDELTNTKNSLNSLQEEMRGYASEVKGLVSKRIKYYTDYEEEKDKNTELSDKIKDLENTMDKLNSEIAEAETRYTQKEAEVVYNDAFLYAKSGMYDETVKSFLRYLELTNDSDADIHYNVAILYDQILKNKYEAIRHYKRYLELNPSAKDLYEINMRIESLERSTRETKPYTMRDFKVNLDELKY